MINVTKINTYLGHKDCVYTVADSPDNRQFVSAGGEGFVVLWEQDGDENGQLLVQVPHSVYAACSWNDKNQLIIGQNYEGIHMVDIAAKKEINSLKLGDSAIFDILLTGDYILVGTGDGTLFVIEQETMLIRRKIRAGAASLRTLATNGGEVIAGYSDNHIRVFDAKNFRLVRDFEAHDNSVFTVKFSPDGRYLLSGGRDARIRIWNAGESYKAEDSIVAHMYAVNSIDFSPDGNYYASASMDKTIKIWDANQFKLLKVIDKTRHDGHLTSVNKLFWSNYKNRLISCSDDRSIAVWEINFKAQP